MPAHRRTIRRRPRTTGGDPPREVLDDGRIPHAGPRAQPFLDWLRSAHPEIDPLDDLLVGAVLDEINDRAAAEIVRHYCHPNAHPHPKEHRL